MKKYLGGLALLVFVATLFTTPLLVVTRIAKATPNILNEWSGTHLFIGNDGSICYIEERSTTTEGYYNHPYTSIPYPPERVAITGIKGYKVHADHNVTTNVYSGGTYYHYLNAPCTGTKILNRGN